MEKEYADTHLIGIHERYEMLAESLDRKGFIPNKRIKYNIAKGLIYKTVNRWGMDVYTVDDEDIFLPAEEVEASLATIDKYVSNKNWQEMQKDFGW